MPHLDFALHISMNKWYHLTVQIYFFNIEKILSLSALLTGSTEPPEATEKFMLLSVQYTYSFPMALELTNGKAFVH